MSTHPVCTHAFEVQVTSHEDVLQALRDGHSIASVLSCTRAVCLTSAKAWVHDRVGTEAFVRKVTPEELKTLWD
jgi:hypothetical protein